MRKVFDLSVCIGANLITTPESAECLGLTGLNLLDLVDSLAWGTTIIFRWSSMGALASSLEAISQFFQK